MGDPAAAGPYDAELGADPELGAEPEGGVPPPDGASPGAGRPLELLPMSGQFLVEPVPGLVPEFEEPEDELEEPEVSVPGLVLVPVLEPELPEPELEVVVDVVAASATSAPPTTRPEVNAPMASARRIGRCMGGGPFVSYCTRRTGGHRTR